MIRTRDIKPAIVVSVLLFTASTAPVHAGPYGWFAKWRAARTPWHCNYYHAAWGQPVALVVPPTAEMQTNWSWGVSGTRITPNYHQFARPYPGDWYPGPAFQPTPAWPSDTAQFGVYYVRGPW